MWNFAETKDTTIIGSSNSSMDIFDNDGSILREIIQNSLDAKRDDCDNVVIEIEFNQRKTADIPGYDSLSKTVSACYDRFKNSRKDEKVLADMKVLLANNNHHVVTFRDSNTRGLRGGLDEKDIDTDMFQLIKVEGSTNKMETDSSAGSFGIGKNAPFIKAGLRTLFYESNNIEGNSVVIGKSILVSHKLDDSLRVPRGYYDNKNSIINYIGNSVLKGYGTAIHIPFYRLNDIDTEISNMIVDVLENFMVAIAKGLLEIKFIDNVEGNGTITIDNGSYYSELMDVLDNIKRKKLKIDPKREKHLRISGKLLTSKNTIKNTIDLDNDNSAEIFLLTKEDSEDSKIQISMREQLIYIQDRKNKCLNSYDAIVIYRGRTLNDALRSSEPAQHNKWIKKKMSHTDKKLVEKAYEKVDAYIDSHFKLNIDDRIILKEFNNSLLDESKEKQDFFNIRELDQKSTLKIPTNTKTGIFTEGGYHNGTNKIRNKDNKKIKTSIGNLGDKIHAINTENITKKVRAVTDNKYRIITTLDLSHVNTDSLKLFCINDNGDKQEIYNSSFDIIDNQEVIVNVDNNSLDVFLSVEVSHEIS